ncbi:MAG: DEAD/DEAH box helicase [Deltaproteobacteria bacterium]|nr:DEAD/DEAH box helicase [Deltaproteobacteria bacterium]
MEHEHFSIALSPQGMVHLLPDAGKNLSDKIRLTFARSGIVGLLYLGLSPTSDDLPPDISYWIDFSRLFFSHLCRLPELTNPDLAITIQIPVPHDELTTFATTPPPMMGAEYLNVDVLTQIWDQLQTAFQKELSGFLASLSKSTENPVQSFFESHGSVLNLIGRVCFHLAENKNNPVAPFAFLATYTHKLSMQGKAQHIPLGKALEEYAGAKNKVQLLQLLTPVQKAASQSEFIKGLVDSGEVYHPLAWTPQEAHQFLKNIPVLESSGVVVRIPDWWKPKQPSRPQVSVTIGNKGMSAVGANALLDFSVSVTLGGEKLSEEELRQILAGTNGLVLLRGQWTEVDKDKLKEALKHWKTVERHAEDGLSFIEGMRLLSGAAIGGDDGELFSQASADWSQVVAGEVLAKQLAELKDPQGKIKSNTALGAELKTTLRPYQQIGVQWLWFLNRLGLGACLADDMGLGKTVQVIALFLMLQKEKMKVSQNESRINLLVVPASLIGNWKSEIEKFAPSLKYFIAHPSAIGTDGQKTGDIENPSQKILQDTDVVITTYGFLGRLNWLKKTSWNVIVIDEAQAIKNPGTKQTRAVKDLKSRHRLALTGTPVENHLSDLWSIYDFLCPGLLSSAKAFEKFVKACEKNDATQPYGALRDLVRPYLLRRLKTDKRIISDLPDKTELSVYCPLTKAQAALYQQSVDTLARQLDEADGIQRRGIILASLMRFKQICNHPSQWFSDGKYAPQDSGKFNRLREICEEIAAKQEKLLVFTQFREITEPLSRFLAGIFARTGLVLHGETTVKNRGDMVKEFQEEQGPPHFVLSLKAGGTGLNLTAASHVIHFDRWWNPAVENQATDRAFRIGQKKNVLVHKFICRGTIEERIDELIKSKQKLSQEILEGSQDAVLTEMSNTDLIKLVSLDLKSAIEES